MLAMHMANELLTPPVAVGFGALVAGVLALAARRTQARFDPQRVPLMGVLGAFIFAAQMINFPILPGTSGHLGGGVLLAILLGPDAATLVMASILIVQCLIFQDGGILALGTNILNIGIVPCYLGYAVYRGIAGGGRLARQKTGKMPVPQSGAPHPAIAQATSGCSAGRLYAGVFVAALVGMTAGAALVPVETAMSGVLAVPFSKFLLVMVGLHLLIALVEAVITFGVVAYVMRARPELLGDGAAALAGAAGRLSMRAVAGSFLVVALLLAGLGSLLASKWPDALDSRTSVEAQTRMVRGNTGGAVSAASDLQARTAPLADYQAKGVGERLGTSLSGLFGVAITIAVIWVVGRRVNRQHAHTHNTPTENPSADAVPSSCPPPRSTGMGHPGSPMPTRTAVGMPPDGMGHPASAEMSDVPFSEGGH